MDVRHRGLSRMRLKRAPGGLLRIVTLHLGWQQPKIRKFGKFETDKLLNHRNILRRDLDN